MREMRRFQPPLTPGLKSAGPAGSLKLLTNRSRGDRHDYNSAPVPVFGRLRQAERDSLQHRSGSCNFLYGYPMDRRKFSTGDPNYHNCGDLIPQAFSHIPTAIRRLRPMKGGSQADLVAGTDGKYYVVKYKENPEGTRSLVNDFLGAHIFLSLGINTAPAGMIAVTPQFLQYNGSVGQRDPLGPCNVRAGVHFTSLYAGDPMHVVVHDLGRSAVIRKFLNQEDFIGALVADRWLAHCDSRQAIYFRHSGGWMCQMIDFGQILGGSEWRLSDPAFFSLAMDRSVYRVERPLEHLQKWIDRVKYFPEVRLFEIAAAIPEEWLGRERTQFERVLDKLLVRRDKIHELVESGFQHKMEPFGSWLVA